MEDRDTGAAFLALQSPQFMEVWYGDEAFRVSLLPWDLLNREA